MYARDIFGDSGKSGNASTNTAFVQKILHITAQKREPNVQHHRQADDLGACFEVPEWGVFCHSARMQSRLARLKLVLSDSTADNA